MNNRPIHMDDYEDAQRIHEISSRREAEIRRRNEEWEEKQSKAKDEEETKEKE